MSQQIVAQAKADLIAAGVNISGNNGALLIVSEAASRMTGFGLVDKPNGNHAELDGAFYSVDGMMDKQGWFYDCLIDGGGANEPTFNHSDDIDPARWRPAKAIIGGRIPSDDEDPLDDDLTALLKSFIPAAANSMDVGHASLRELHVKVNALQESLSALEAKQPATGGGEFKLTPEMLAMLMQAFRQALEGVARVTVTPKKLAG